MLTNSCNKAPTLHEQPKPQQPSQPARESSTQLASVLHIPAGVSQLPGQSLISSRLIPHVCPAAVSVSPGLGQQFCHLPSARNGISAPPPRSARDQEGHAHVHPLSPCAHCPPRNRDMTRPTLSLSRTAITTTISRTLQYPRTRRPTVADSQCQHHTTTSVPLSFALLSSSKIQLPYSTSRLTHPPLHQIRTHPGSPGGPGGPGWLAGWHFLAKPAQSTSVQVSGGLESWLAGWLGALSGTALLQLGDWLAPCANQHETDRLDRSGVTQSATWAKCQSQLSTMSQRPSSPSKLQPARTAWDFPTIPSQQTWQSARP